MPGKKVTVVISQGQSQNPEKRHLEEDLAAALIMNPQVDVSLVPHLYDLSADHTGVLFLRSVPGDLVILSWLYPRAIRWTLDRIGVRGQEGVSQIVGADFDEDEEAPEPQGIGSVDAPPRKIYCINLADRTKPQEFLDEIARIADECTVQTVDLMQWIGGSPNKLQLERYLHPEQMLAKSGASPAGNDGATALAEPTKRRWYPVIDYSRCTNCMECIDFCLFGVYGVDTLDRILVEEQDNCKKGCPACSRVCPENAIIFPGHKTPAIAGADGEIAGLKIDLSALFGAPSALEVAAMERDTELVRDGRDAVGMSVGIPKRQADRQSAEPDALDKLIDSLDDLDL